VPRRQLLSDAPPYSTSPFPLTYTLVRAHRWLVPTIAYVGISLTRISHCGRCAVRFRRQLIFINDRRCRQPRVTNSRATLIIYMVTKASRVRHQHAWSHINDRHRSRRSPVILPNLNTVHSQIGGVAGGILALRCCSPSHRKGQACLLLPSRPLLTPLSYLLCQDTPPAIPFLQFHSMGPSCLMSATMSVICWSTLYCMAQKTHASILCASGGRTRCARCSSRQHCLLGCMSFAGIIIPPRPHLWRFATSHGTI